MFKKPYPALSFRENFLGGHICLGSVTVYGENAMHWTVNIKTSRWGYVCFRLPFRCFGSWWPLYFYVSPNATPWASTLYMGESKSQKKKSKIRREKYGHNFNTELLQEGE